MTKIDLFCCLLLSFFIGTMDSDVKSIKLHVYIKIFELKQITNNYSHQLVPLAVGSAAFLLILEICTLKREKGEKENDI